MTTSNDNSNYDNQSFSFPLSLYDPLNEENQMNMSNVFHWINSIEFTRPKKTISRDFSDASKNKNKSQCICLTVVLIIVI